MPVASGFRQGLHPSDGNAVLEFHTSMSEEREEGEGFAVAEEEGHQGLLLVELFSHELFAIISPVVSQDDRLQ